MRYRFWITLTSIMLVSPAFSAVNPDGVLVANLPAGWKQITSKPSPTGEWQQYIPSNESEAKHSKILVQTSVARSSDNPSAFADYHQNKIRSLMNRGCKITPKITSGFKQLNSPYELFTYECSHESNSGLDIIVDARHNAIYDLMYEVSAPDLNNAEYQTGISILSTYKICYATDPACINH